MHTGWTKWSRARGACAAWQRILCHLSLSARTEELQHGLRLTRSLSLSSVRRDRFRVSKAGWMASRSQISTAHCAQGGPNAESHRTVAAGNPVAAQRVSICSGVSHLGFLNAPIQSSFNQASSTAQPSEERRVRISTKRRNLAQRQIQLQVSRTYASRRTFLFPKGSSFSFVSKCPQEDQPSPKKEEMTGLTPRG